MTDTLNENPGCLGAIFNLFGGKKKVKRVDSSADTTIDEPEEVFPYRLRDDFLSPAEFSFYRILSSLTGTERVVQSKVRLADLFFVARPNENAKYYNKITAKHLDFLVCDATTMKPLLGIELDDASHQRSERIERDEFVDKVFQAASLPLLHVPNQRSYSTREIDALISPHIDITNSHKETSPAESKPPAVQISENKPASPAAAPICPKCGIPMVLRIVTQGEHKGKKFYGCPNFPRCREVKPYSNQS
ncbi:protein containg Zn-finger domain associated with topoisomerase type I [Longilinea arvoryzae]|uniref:Protein containg Zn-finger domain associated with topoisomerase type I n=2 Tax=Longilinea arvoryzae TaxID=360412 RepID=A0A0S7BC59_9CHLR|nr:protein containg Zn-finger domain associated with topoisomerase type I [Longilinea arvoryzae]